MSLENSVSPLEKRIIELEDENKSLRETVTYLTRKLYVSSSEKTSVLGIEDQSAEKQQKERQSL